MYNVVHTLKKTDAHVRGKLTLSKGQLCATKSNRNGNDKRYELEKTVDRCHQPNNLQLAMLRGQVCSSKGKSARNIGQEATRETL